MVSLRTQNGPELLKSPAACFTVLDSQGGVLKDGAPFQVESWRPSYCSSYSEIEVALKAPERVVWRLRLYIDKPYLEQRFEMPDAWRAAGNSVRQVLDLQPSLKPVMPNRVFLKGFSNGRPNLKDRARFEFVQQSDHLTYDPTAAAGLATFVAGIGGEEIIVHDSLSMVDHVTTALGPSEPIARFILWPFAGPGGAWFPGDKEIRGRRIPDQNLAPRQADLDAVLHLAMGAEEAPEAIEDPWWRRPLPQAGSHGGPRSRRAAFACQGGL